jgi:hypothetical protein
VTFDTYLVAEVTPDLYGRFVRVSNQWTPWPVDGTLWRIDLAGGYYALRVGSMVLTAMATDEISIEAWV